MNDTPIGYIRVNQEFRPENGRVYYTFARWDGHEWVKCWPDNADELIAGRTTSRGEIHNAY